EKLTRKVCVDDMCENCPTEEAVSKCTDHTIDTGRKQDVTCENEIPPNRPQSVRISSYLGLGCTGYLLASEVNELGFCFKSDETTWIKYTCLGQNVYVHDCTGVDCTLCEQASRPIGCTNIT